MEEQLVGSIDLNIGKNYLNDWNVHYAIREIIANALDEGKNEIPELIEKAEEEYIIRDFSSGLKIENFIMMGSDKANNKNVIGKFGVGLKDALGVLNNNGIRVKIITNKYIFKPNMQQKSRIMRIKTLHVQVYRNSEQSFRGTMFILRNCKREYIEQAKNEFLIYKNQKTQIIEKTCYGDILIKENNVADIYINGMKISEDRNLSFSYNIKSISARLKSAINRERKYVNRDAYREDIKRIINKCKEKHVLDAFEEQLRKTYSDNSYSEIKWNTVLVTVSNYIISKYKHKNVKFIGNVDIQNKKELYDLLCKSSNAEIINVSQKIKEDIKKYKEDIIGDSLFIEDSNSYITEKDLLSIGELDESRRKVLEEAIYILKKVDFIKNDYISIDNIKVSRVSVGSFMHKEGIVIPLNSLTDLETCAVKIINVLSSLGDNSTEYKDKIVGNLIKIIYERNKSIKN